MTDDQEMKRLMEMMQNSPGFKLYSELMESGLSWSESTNGVVKTERSIDTDRGPITISASITERDGVYQSAMRAAKLPMAQDKTREYGSLDDAKEGATKELATMASSIADLSARMGR